MGHNPRRSSGAVVHHRSSTRASAALSAAIDLYRAMEMTFWLPQAEAALARVEER
jgi:hypothetical protein